MTDQARSGRRLRRRSCFNSVTIIALRFEEKATRATTDQTVSVP